MIRTKHIKRVRTIAMISYLISAVLLMFFAFSLPDTVMNYIRGDIKLILSFIVSQVLLMTSNTLLDRTLEAIEKIYAEKNTKNS